MAAISALEKDCLQFLDDCYNMIEEERPSLLWLPVLLCLSMLQLFIATV